jgi:hypothetical protein
VTFVNGELRIYASSIPAKDRRVCLMQDPIYRHDVTHRAMGYPHVPMTSYFLGVTTSPAVKTQSKRGPTAPAHPTGSF